MTLGDCRPSLPHRLFRSLSSGRLRPHLWSQPGRKRCAFNAARFRIAFVQLRPATRRAFARRLKPQLPSSGLSRPTRSQSSGPKRKGQSHERAFRHPPTHHQSDRCRHRARRWRIPPSLARQRRYDRAAEERRIEEALSRREHRGALGGIRAERIRLWPLGHVPPVGRGWRPGPQGREILLCRLL